MTKTPRKRILVARCPYSDIRVAGRGFAFMMITDAHPGRRKGRLSIISRAALKRLGLLAGCFSLALVAAYFMMIRMPGSSYRGPLTPLSDTERESARFLREHVDKLAGSAGSRSTFNPRGMASAARHIIAVMDQLGYPMPREIPVERGSPVPNLEYSIAGTDLATEIVVVGAHLDAFQGTPGADDNASGCAALLQLARALAGTPQRRTIKLVFFVNEEPPAFWTKDMGSWVYTKQCRTNGDDIVAMLSLESLGYYSDQPNSQKYPPGLGWLFPNQGNFVAVVGNVSSRSLVRRVVATFRETTAFPAEGAALPGFLPGVGWSDHWSFWQEGYPAVMLTDTAIFRNPHYHRATDTPDTLDFDRMARVVLGIERVVRSLANSSSP